MQCHWVTFFSRNRLRYRSKPCKVAMACSSGGPYVILLLLGGFSRHVDHLPSKFRTSTDNILILPKNPPQSRKTLPEPRTPWPIVLRRSLSMFVLIVRRATTGRSCLIATLVPTRARKSGNARLVANGTLHGQAYTATNINIARPKTKSGLDAPLQDVGRGRFP
jgi:hypothetical protein